MWRFPEIGVPPNHPNFSRIFLINHLFWGSPMTMETAMWGIPHDLRLPPKVVKVTESCGAIRHGAECFNFYFPQVA